MRLGIIASCVMGFFLASVMVSSAQTKDNPPYMTVQFSIGEYSSWRTVFDAAEPLRQAAGITNPRIYRRADNPTEILIIFDIPSKKAARKWISSPELRSAWAEGGVLGEPIVGFVNFQPMKGP